MWFPVSPGHTGTCASTAAAGGCGWGCGWDCVTRDVYGVNTGDPALPALGLSPQLQRSGPQAPQRRPEAGWEASSSGSCPPTSFWDGMLLKITKLVFELGKFKQK